MRGKKAKVIRRAVVRLYEQNQAKFPIGYKLVGQTVVSVRRIMYQRIKRLTNTEKMTLAQVREMFA